MIELIIVFLIVILDQITKYLAKVYIKPLEFNTIPIIKNIFHLTYVENRGAAFSMLQNHRWFFISLTIVFVIIATIYIYKNRKLNRLWIISITIVLGGAIGNLIDRVILGYVIDFFDFRIINFAVFNIADCAVTIGSIIMAYYILFIYDEKSNENK